MKTSVAERIENAAAVRGKKLLFSQRDDAERAVIVGDFLSEEKNGS
jgi:hypothetical protein